MVSCFFLSEVAEVTAEAVVC